MTEEPGRRGLLAGKRIVVTRAQEQSAGLSRGLRSHGAEVIEAPAIRIEPPSDLFPLDRAIHALAGYDWVVFTSANGVAFFFDRLQTLGRTPLDLAHTRLAVIGPATLAALEAHGLRASVVPEKFVAEEVFEAMERLGPLRGRRILLPRADIAREALPDLLRREGAEVDVVIAYRTVPANEETRRAVDLVSRGLIDVVTFTSGSTVRSFFSAVEDAERLRGRFVAASIGPITSRALTERGFPPAIEAEMYTSEGLVEAIARFFAHRGPGESGVPMSRAGTIGSDKMTVE